jgi:hypothetical protein
MLDVLVLSFLIALIRGGRLSGRLAFNHPWIIIAALALQVVTLFLPPAVGPVLIIISYLVLIAGLAFNLNRQSIRLLLVGVLLNLVVIGLNLGRMPVSVPAAGHLGFNTAPLVNGTDYKRVAMSDQTRFNFLGDVIYVPYPMPRVMSIGDVVIALGAFMLVQELMSKPITFEVRRLSL